MVVSLEVVIGCKSSFVGFGVVEVVRCNIFVVNGNFFFSVLWYFVFCIIKNDDFDILIDIYSFRFFFCRRKRIRCYLMSGFCYGICFEYGGIVGFFKSMENCWGKGR